MVAFFFLFGGVGGWGGITFYLEEIEILEPL